MRLTTRNLEILMQRSRGFRVDSKWPSKPRTTSPNMGITRFILILSYPLLSFDQIRLGPAPSVIPASRKDRFLPTLPEGLGIDDKTTK